MNEVTKHKVHQQAADDRLQVMKCVTASRDDEMQSNLSAFISLPQYLRISLSLCLHYR